MTKKQVSRAETRMPLTSADIVAERMDGLRQLFPEVFAEGKIDFEKLKLVLGEEIDEGPERYGLTWAGKADAIRAIQVPSVGTLAPVREESVDFDSTENLMIEGDNLEVLKLLQKAYHGRIKMIYIDPPYNTGKEFIYPDNFREGLKDYLRYSGQMDDEGLKLSSNTETSGRYHSKWLSMMYPRLFLARNLLREDGVIFVSIDDHEVHNLRHLMDEIFGPENFVAVFAWQKKYSRDNRPVVGTVHDYIVLYAKNSAAFAEVRNLLPPNEDSTKVYRNPNNDPRGRWRPIPMTAQAGHATSNQFYEITTPTGVVHKPPEGRCWGVSKATYEKLLAEGRIWFGKSGSSQPNIIRYLSEIEGFVPWSWLPSKEVGHTDEAKKELYALVGKENAFETPKPTRLILHLLRIATDPHSEDIVLDFFAGTGTTGEAVLRLNAEDGGNRRFLLVQLPEPTDLSVHPTIAHITRARLRAASAAVKKACNEKLDLNGSHNIDLGFRTYKLTSSNFKIWEPAADAEEELARQLELYADNLVPGAKPEAILYELMLKAGIPLTAPVEKLKLGGQEVFSIEGGRLLICLADPITRECIRAMIAKKPQMVICLDHAFRGNDQLLTNTVLEMKSHGVEHFRTV